MRYVPELLSGEHFRIRFVHFLEHIRMLGSLHLADDDHGADHEDDADDQADRGILDDAGQDEGDEGDDVSA